MKLKHKKLTGTDYYVRKIKIKWIKRLLFSDITNDENDAELKKYMFDLCSKILCDEKGQDVDIEELELDEFKILQKYLLNSISQKKS